jgi:FkbM family methyltransferase
MNLDYYFQKCNNLLVIGAYDGKKWDEFYPYIMRYGNMIENVAFVEPVPWNLDKCKETFSMFPHFKFLNAAIGDKREFIDFITIDPDQEGNVPDWVLGCSMVGTEYKTERGTNLLEPYTTEDLKQYTKVITTAMLTIPDLLATVLGDWPAIDILKTDTEGYDWKIIQQLTLKDKERPKLIHFETGHLKDETIPEIATWFRNNGYAVTPLVVDNGRVWTCAATTD